MSEKNEIDRWRSSLEEAEQELAVKTQHVEDLQSFYCDNITKLMQRIDHDNTLKDELAEFINASCKTSSKAAEITQLKLSIKQLLLKSSDLLLFQSETQIDVAEKNTADNASSLNQQDPSQFCALLISEILYQLLEKISLPKDLSDRLGELKKQLHEGVTMNKWAGMLTEVSDMAADVQSKINHERLDIEVFLKQVTGRLLELDEYIQGSRKHYAQSKQHSKALGDAVKMEMRSLANNTDAEIDIKALKQQIQNGLAAIEKHIDGYKQIETDHHDVATADVQKLLGRLSELEQESKNLKARVQKERMQAQMDPLTGIANRLGYDQHLMREYARWKRFGNPLSLVVWDIDHFKRINDDYGHAAGDKALKTIATLLAGKVRETDYLARFGGEEFVLIMPGANAKSAKVVAEKLRELVAKSGFHFKGAPVSITISAGIAEFVEGDAPQAVFEKADAALYKAKEKGRNQVVVAED